MKKKRKPSSNSNLPAVRHAAVPEVISDREPLSPRDPLARYLQELRRHPVLSPEEQHDLAVKFMETGDVSLAKLLVTTNLRLVVKIAMEYRNAYSNVLDLIQEGNVGLMKAVANFDPYKGTRLSYYASWWIRSYILKFILDNFRLVKIGTTQAQKKLFYNLIREKERLEAQGIQAGPKLLADQLNVKEKDVREMSLRLSSRGGEVPLDQPMGAGEEGDGPTRADLISDESESVEDTLMRQQMEDILRDRIGGFLELLNEKERAVFQDRLMSEEPSTLQEVADKFGLTRERSRQIEARVIEKLRDYLRGSIGDIPVQAKTQK